MGLVQYVQTFFRLQIGVRLTQMLVYVTVMRFILGNQSWSTVLVWSLCHRFIIMDYLFRVLVRLITEPVDNPSLTRHCSNVVGKPVELRSYHNDILNMPMYQSLDNTGAFVPSNYIVSTPDKWALRHDLGPPSQQEEYRAFIATIAHELGHLCFAQWAWSYKGTDWKWQQRAYYFKTIDSILLSILCSLLPLYLLYPYAILHLAIRCASLVLEEHFADSYELTGTTKEQLQASANRYWNVHILHMIRCNVPKERWLDQAETWTAAILFDPEHPTPYSRWQRLLCHIRELDKKEKAADKTPHRPRLLA